MLIAAVLCLCAAVATAAMGLWSLAGPTPPTRSPRFCGPWCRPSWPPRSMLAAGGVVALAAPPHAGVLALVVCVVGAVGTVAAGCYQSAKSVALREAAREARRRTPAAQAPARRARCPATDPTRQLRLTSIGWVASSDNGIGWRRSTRDHRSTLGSTRTSDGNADNTIQSSRSISPSSWPMVHPE